MWYYLCHSCEANAIHQIWEINGIVYTPPDLPTLLKIINGATVASDFNVSEHTFILNPNEVVELHIHGADHGTLSFFFVSCFNYKLNLWIRNHSPLPSSVSYSELFLRSLG
jgi:hypothetical protein